MKISRPALWPALLLAMTGAMGCSAPTSGSGFDGVRLTGLAASSLSDVFDELGREFEAATPGVEITFGYAASSTLREQVLSGAPADLLATADVRSMGAVVDQGLIASTPQVFATNRLVIAVPSGNPGSVTGLPDFAEEDLLIGLCAPEVPCGRLAREVLAAAGVSPAPDTEEPNVRSLLTKVVSGELDAGLVFETDAQAAGDAVEVIELPAAVSRATTYPLGVLADRPHRDLAEAFVEFVLGPVGQRILADHGFGPP